MKLISLATTALTLCLVGCSATGPVFQEAAVPQGSALLYVYRPDSFALGARTAVIEIDGKRAVGLKNNGYAAIPLSPGSYQVTQRWDAWLGDREDLLRPITVQVAVEAGIPAFLRLGTASNMTSTTVGLRWELRRLPQEQAMPELSKTNRVDAERP
jgi:hypothetical protein